MLVKLADLKPNPMRDFKVDPMDPDAIERLKVSIKEDGFWGGVVCRLAVDGSVEIGAGHHRVEAAIAVGVKEAELFVGEFNDAGMVRIYARENATQRGDAGVSQTGSVASALRLIAKAALAGLTGEFTSQDGTPIQIDFDRVRRRINCGDGVGRDSIQELLKGTPGINDQSTKQALSNLKDSGHYKRIIEEVQAEIDREHQEAMAELEKADAERKAAEEAACKAEEERKAAESKAKAAREEAVRKQAELDRQRAEAEAKLAEKRKREASESLAKMQAIKATKSEAAEKAVKAAAKAAERPKTFDFDGVSKHLKNSHQIDVFRDVVTGAGVLPYLPVENQAALAEHLVALAKKRDAELSGAFIRDNAVTAVLDVKRFERKLSKQDQDNLLANDMAKRAKAYQHDFAGGIRTALAYGTRLIELRKKFIEAGVPFPVTDEFRRVLDESASRFAELKKWL